MFQQGGYGQIYGIGVGGGGGAVGATIYSAANESVRFARMVERQKLNLQRRALSLQEAQLKANQKAQQQRMQMEQLQLRLQDKKLVMADAARQADEERALRAYDLQLQKLQMDAAQREKDYELQQQRLWLDQDREARLADAQLFNQEMQMEKSEAQTRGGSEEKPLKFTDSQKAQMGVIDADVANIDKGKTGIQKELDALEEQLESARREASEAKGKARKLAEENLNMLEERKKQLQERKTDTLRARALRDYQIRSKQDPTILEDVRYQDWRDVPWENIEKDTDKVRQTMILDLLRSDAPAARQLLREVVARKGDADAWAVGKYLDVAKANPDVGNIVPMGDWLDIPWGTISAIDSARLEELLLHSANSVQAAAAIKAFLKKHNKNK